MKKIEFNRVQSIFTNHLLSKKDSFKVLGGCGSVFIHIVCIGGETLRKGDYGRQCNGSDTKLSMTCTGGSTLSALV